MVDVLSSILVPEQMVIADLVVVGTILSRLGRGSGDRQRNRSPLGNEDSLRPQHPNLTVPEREALLEFGEGHDVAIDLPQIGQPRKSSHPDQAVGRTVHRTRTVDDSAEAGPPTSHHMRHQIDVGRDTMDGFIESKNEPAVAEDGR